MKIRILFFCFLSLIFVEKDAFSAGKFKMELQPEGLYLNNLNTGLMQKIFDDFGYMDFINEDMMIPPIMLDTMPVDFDKVSPQSERNRLFIMIMAPLILKVNEEIVMERDEIEQVKKDLDAGKKLNKKQRKKLDAWATKYDVFTRMKGNDKYDIILNKLLLKVDMVPPSLVIAVAAAESNWGTADEVKEGNSLFKLKDWYTTKGIKPKDETDDSYRIRVYPDLLSAIRDYALKLNSDINFQHLWISRQQLRRHRQVVKGRLTVYNMVIGSPLENYAGLLTYILTFYDLVNIDMSELSGLSSIVEKK